MFYSKQLLARKAPLGQIWMAATLNGKIKRKELDELDIILICEEILNPPVPMALRMSAILMGGVVNVYDRKVKLLLDDVNSFMTDVKRAFRPGDPTLLPRGKTHARKAAITLPENEDADFGDPDQLGSSRPNFPNHQTFIFMRLDEYEADGNPEADEPGQHLHHQANADDITLFEPEYNASFQTYSEMYDRYDRFDIIEGDDETQMNIDPRDGAEIPSTLIPSPPRNQDIPEVVGNPISPQRQQQHEHGVFAEQMEEQNIPGREEHDRPQPAKRRARKAAKLVMDYETTIISGPEYQLWLKDASDILCKGKKRKARGTITTEMRMSKLMDLPPIILCGRQPGKEHLVDNFYPPQINELWSKPLLPSTLIQPQNNNQSDQHNTERLRTTLGTDVLIEGEGSMDRPHLVTPVAMETSGGGDDGISVGSTPSARGVASSSAEINPQRPMSSPRRGLEPVAEDRAWDSGALNFELSEQELQVQVETGPTQTQMNQTEDRLTESIKSHLKTHFETSGATREESLNKLAFGMKRNAAAKLFYQSCVLATRGDIKVSQKQPYADILISRGPNM